MVIFKDYTTSDVLFDLPYEEKDRLRLFPIKVKDYKKFETLSILYLLFSKRHYELDNNANLFEYVIGVNLARHKIESTNKKQELTNEELLMLVIAELESLFSIICREDIFYDKDYLYTDGEIVFVNKDKTIRISKNNFEKIRQIVLKQNVIREPKIFENKLEENLGKKYMKALQNKNKGEVISELGDIANFVSCFTGKSYDVLYQQNIMQLQVDFCRCVSLDTYRTKTLFATVDSSTKINNLTEEVITRLFADPYANMWKDMSSFGFLQ